jgi:hypothetical protein
MKGNTQMAMDDQRQQQEFINEDLGEQSRNRLVKQIRNEMKRQNREIADLVFANPKLQNRQTRNFLIGGGNIHTSTLMQIAIALGGEIKFVPRKTRRRK